MVVKVKQTAIVALVTASRVPGGLMKFDTMPGGGIRAGV